MSPNKHNTFDKTLGIFKYNSLTYREQLANYIVHVE